MESLFEKASQSGGAKIKKIGLIVNPIAGMGGRVGLKGTDGWDIVEKAMKLGAKPWSEERAERMLRTLLPLLKEIKIFTYPGEMGENIAKKLGYDVEVIGKIEGERISAEDTRRAAKEMTRKGCELILFVGGDGTTRDIYDAVGLSVPVIGVPAGVKMYSAVFASGPERGGELAVKYLRGMIKELQEREVMDIDEEKYRNGIFAVRLYGYLMVPYDKRYVIGGKSPTGISEKANQEAIAVDIIENMDDETYYILGPGTTTKMILKKMEVRYSLLGVDILYRRKVVGLDLNERDILRIIAGKKTKIIISPLGGQGYLFGRGNQQISPSVIMSAGGKKSIIIVATQQKILNLEGKPFLVDTNDPLLDRQLSGWYRVITGYRERWMYRVEYG
ncbi:MAG: ATP-NAD kinase family protein [Thermoplasmata archaeon]|nr:ATP-NAD kinase family protein [Thermoplasmata archaeon]